MRGIEGISEELNKIADPLLATDLMKVLNAALDITADEYSPDPDIRDVIEFYQADPRPSPALAEELSQKSRECDEMYILLEEEGQIEKSEANFCKMCILNGLHSLFAAASLTPRIVDHIIYDLGHGAPDIDFFAERMIERLKA